MCSFVPKVALLAGLCRQGSRLKSTRRTTNHTHPCSFLLFFENNVGTLRPAWLYRSFLSSRTVENAGYERRSFSLLRSRVMDASVFLGSMPRIRPYHQWLSTWIERFVTRVVLWRPASFWSMPNSIRGEPRTRVRRYMLSYVRVHQRYGVRWPRPGNDNRGAQKMPRSLLDRGHLPIVSCPPLSPWSWYIENIPSALGVYNAGVQTYWSVQQQLCSGSIGHLSCGPPQVVTVVVVIIILCRRNSIPCLHSTRWEIKR